MTDDAVLDPDQERVLGALLGMRRRSWEQGVTGHALLDLGVTGSGRAAWSVAWRVAH